MKKVIKMSLLLTLSILAVIVILVTSFFYLAPQIGAEPKGERLEKMQKSVNYTDGKFLNTIETTMDLSLKDMSSSFYEIIKGDDSRQPSEVINTMSFNKDLFEAVSDSELAVNWFGHSSILMKIENTIILADPVFSDRASMFSFMGPKRYNYSDYLNPEELPSIDVLLISHDHYDHLDYETIREIKDIVKVFLVPLGVGAHLERWGVQPERIKEFDWWEETSINESLNLAFVPSRHFSGRAFTDRSSTLWGAWVIQGKHKSVFFGGDSGYFPGFTEIGDKYGPFDIAMLECGQYNQKWANIHMMPEETVQASIDLKASLLMPIHWGKFTLSLHPWKESIERAELESHKKGVNILSPQIGSNMFVFSQLPTDEWWKNVK